MIKSLAKVGIETALLTFFKSSKLPPKNVLSVKTAARHGEAQPKSSRSE